MNIDNILSNLAEPLNHMTLHNVRLVDVQPGPDGYEALTVEYQGEVITIASGGKWRVEYSRRDVNRVGYLISAGRSFGTDLPDGACYFHAYYEPSLRRLPEFDLTHAMSIDGRQPAVIGWICDQRPQGFRAPVGIIPGENGAFVPDETEEVTLRIPPEFIRECKRYQRSPAELLRGFVGDLAGITNFVKNPRADHYTSNGSDERNYAEAWIERAYGGDCVDLSAIEDAEYAEEEQQFRLDELGNYLDEYVEHGGNADDLINAVEAIVNKQISKE